MTSIWVCLCDKDARRLHLADMGRSSAVPVQNAKSSGNGVVRILSADFGEQVEEFVGSDGGGAELADDHTGGGVGETRGVSERGACG
jgi:hypothetical protein